MDSTIPPTLAEAISTEPAWLQIWLLILVTANLGALLFVAQRRNGSWLIRKEAFAIVVSFFAAGMLMEWLYQQYGYVRLLGLAHLVAWTPAYAYAYLKFNKLSKSNNYRYYLMYYFVVAGLSLVIDAIDVVRYLLGDGELFLRWAKLTVTQQWSLS